MIPGFKEIVEVEYEARIDKYLGDNTDFSRTEIKHLIDNHAIFVDGIAVRKANFNVREGMQILIVDVLQKEMKAEPENIPLNIIFEDDDIVVINKASGMVVHPAPGHHSGTLVNALLYHFKNLSSINGEVRPGIVHRIDKDTSGLLVVAKNNEAHHFLAEELKKHKIKRVYYAWVEGQVKNQITHINLPIGRSHGDRQKMAVQKENSKDAVTHVFVEKMLANKTFVRCELETGRTHQIRVHLAYIGNPVIGDSVYGKSQDDFKQYLHATRLELLHPRTKQIMTFEAPLPEEFAKLEANFKNK